ncbi:hypothetical protein BLNAU_12129 [Blattamonas nauphoetae]|uniref:Uncharacterized protein n=1 Tax=Blattamonas nauphoetae TaxID=2049346 RepID=A0ABQ9XNN7_9EUKA|nr:hypothetical protein BLNAU_12129 [Blattamonas nauphoetae]
MNDDTANSESRGRLSICGVELSMTNQHFPLGTGPLYTFHSDHVLDSVMHVETTLLSSTLVNVSSSSAFSPVKQLFGSEVSQRVVGTFVRNSTNHDSGTGMMSPNLGGNLVCLNTSFSSCIRQSNEAKDFSFENRTQTEIGRLNNVSYDVTSVTFTLCTFNTMTMSHAPAPLQGGAAIFIYATYSSLTINTCFFHKCTVTGKELIGGAVDMESYYEHKQPFSVSDSSFSECSATKDGGSIVIAFVASTTMENCFFKHSKAENGGALWTTGSIVTLSNCAFVECSSTAGGYGAIYTYEVSRLSFSFVQFRKCSNFEYYYQYGDDVCFYCNLSSQITADMFESCDSTSGAPNVYFRYESRTDSTLIPQITSTPTIKSVDVCFDGSQATVMVEVDQAIKGTMGVLLSGSNVPRLVHVVFGKPWEESRFGTALVHSGANGILPNADYTLLNSSLATGFFIPPSVWIASAALKDWNTTEIVVKGMRLEEGVIGCWLGMKRQNGTSH